MKKMILMLGLFLILVSSGCIEGIITEEPKVTDPLAGPAWVAEHLNDPNVRIIDMSFSKEAYEKQHIPGAVHVDYKTDIVDLDNPVPNQVAPKEKVESLVRRLGIEEDDTVVVYDNTNNMIAARMFYVLRYYGHENIRLLNGGIKAWINSGGKITAEVPDIRPTEYSLKGPNPEIYATLDHVHQNLGNPEIVLVDGRPTDQYTGENVRPGIGRGGHIPGAINIPGSRTWNEDKTIKSIEELKAIYEGAGVTKDKKIVAYCHNGMLGSYTWFILDEVLGYPHVALYDGSMLEWSNNPDVPVTVGSEP